MALIGLHPKKKKNRDMYLCSVTSMFTFKKKKNSMFIMTGLYNKLIIANHHLANLRFTKGWSNFNSLTSLLGSVWIELILLKLKIEN